jgi:hypothetical protein
VTVLVVAVAITVNYMIENVMRAISKRITITMMMVMITAKLMMIPIEVTRVGIIIEVSDLQL